MALTPGTRIGPYEVTGPLGEGGMGIVCRARDTKLQRDIALKLLPDHLAADPDRSARLEREAQVLASLNHPHIAQVYGLEQTDGVSCIVMELVEGPTLADRIAAAAGGLPLDEAVTIALQIVSALEAAHSRSIVHRDLKPANIKITPDGHVKVLDFGLALAEPAAAGISGTAVNVTNSPTVMSASLPGMVMGTLAYMSPEQARGTIVDSRTDVWAFGCVLYEMLTGRQAFHGETPTDIVAKIVTAAPDWGRLPAQTPRAIRQLLRAALDRDPKKRLQHIGDARLFLEAETLPDAVQSSMPARRAGRFVWPALATALALIAGAAIWFAPRSAPAEPGPPLHLTARLPDDINGIGAWITVSRDGSHVAFEANNQLYLLSLKDSSDAGAKPLRGADFSGFNRWPAFSPGGDELAFIDNSGQLKKVAVSGGTPVSLADVGGGTVSWGDDGSILVTSGGSITRIPSAGGGRPETVATADRSKGEHAYVSAELLPGGRYILATTSEGLFRGGLRSGLNVAAVDVKTGKPKELLQNIGNPWFAPSGTRPGVGHIVYEGESGLFAAPFDSNTLEVKPAVLVLEEEQFRLDGRFGFSRSGTLIHFPIALDLGASSVVWTDRKGNEQSLPLIPTAMYMHPRLSPDAGRMVVAIREGRTSSNLWIYNLASSARAQVTFGGMNAFPVWMSDGNRVMYDHQELRPGSDPLDGRVAGAVVSVATDGSNPITLWRQSYQLFGMSRGGVLAARSARGRGAPPNARGRGNFGGRGRLLLLKLGPDGKPVTGEPEPFLDERFNRQDVQFSPDDKWVAFSSTQNGRRDVFVAPFPGPGDAIPISADGGEEPRWNSNGRELFYRNGDKMMAVEISTAGGGFRLVGKPQVLFEKPATGYDVAPNGTRFLVLKTVPRDERPPDLHVILNWFEELRRRAPLPQ